MSEDIRLFEAIYTQRALRRFKPDPIPDSVVERLIEAATKATSGSNGQPWAFVVVRELEMRQRIGEYYRRAWNAAAGPLS